MNFFSPAARSYRRAPGKTQDDVVADPYPSLLAATGKGFCDFCNLCVENCPTGALAAFDPKTQWIGEASIDPINCIAFAKLGGCRKCLDYCPFGAISLDANRRPVVNPALCNGCGVCEDVCVSATYRSYKGQTRRAITVQITGEERPQ